MHNESAIAAYKRASLENAPPLKIVQMLYQGAIRFLDQAAALDPQLRPADYNERLGRADQIVAELRLCLEREHAPQLCEQLEQLYLYAEERIATALIERRREPIAEARAVLLKLLDGWKQLELDGAKAA